LFEDIWPLLDDLAPRYRNRTIPSAGPIAGDGGIGEITRLR